MRRKRNLCRVFRGHVLISYLKIHVRIWTNNYSSVLVKAYANRYIHMQTPFTFTGMNYACAVSCKCSVLWLFIGANQDSCILKIWPFVSTYTCACALLGYSVHFTEAVLQRRVLLTAVDGDAVNLRGWRSYLR